MRHVPWRVAVTGAAPPKLSHGYTDIPRLWRRFWSLLEDKLLKRIDGAARRLGFSRSAYLSHIATLDVERYDGPGKDRQVKGALRSIDELFAAAGRNGDTTRAIREERHRLRPTR